MEFLDIARPESYVDWTIITVCAVSGLMGLKGGFLKESISLFGWILAHFVATVSVEPITSAFGVDLSQNSLLYLFSYGLVFAAVVVFFSTVGAGLSTRLQSGHIKVGNSLLGAAFGICRGVVLLSVMSLLLSATARDLHAEIIDRTVYANYLEATGELLSSGFESEFFNDPNGFLDETVDDASDLAEGA